MNIVMTGVGTGIGKATCLYFLNKGHRVIGVLRNEKHKISLLDSAGPLTKKLSLIYGDLNDPDFTCKIGEQLASINIEDIDVLLNIAGILDTTTYDELSVVQINKIMTVNFVNPAMLISKLMPLIEKNTPGNIINITSMSGFQGSVRFAGLSIYGASKAALASFTESIAAECSQNEVHINALAIGSVNTEMLQKAFPDFVASISPDDMAEYIYSFATVGYKFHQGKVLSVAITNP